MIISYCNNKYPNNYGGVARFDYCLSLIFPERIFFRGPEEIDLLLEFIKDKKNYTIITDNHLASQFPKNIRLIVVHHGVARTHFEREPNWDKKWRNMCVYGQDLIFHKRNPENTLFVSPTQFCINEFERFYGNNYKKFGKILIPHASELDETMYKKDFNKKPVIIGNWIQNSKGKHLIDSLKLKLPEFEFRPLKLDFQDKTIEMYNKMKQQYYIDADIYLGLSIVEGCSYSILDAMLNNLLIVSTNVGILENEVNKESFVELSWRDVIDSNIDLIVEKLEYMWENRDIYFNRSRQEYFKMISWDKWTEKWENIIFL